MSVLRPHGPASAAAMLMLLAGCQQAATTASTEAGERSAATDTDLAPRDPNDAREPADDAKVTSNGKGLCTAGEQVVFSCRLDNSKLTSVCGTKNKVGDIVAQYRYGKSGETPELTWPDVDSGNRLKFASVPYSGGGEAQLHFRRGDNQYVVYSRVIRTNFKAGEPNDPSLEDGIFVRKGDKIIARHSCADPDVRPIDYEKAELYAQKSEDGIVDFEY